MSIGAILLIIVVLAVIGGLPQVGNHDYGYGPSGLLGVILIIVVVLLVLGRI
jgi:hypothetical protein